MRASCAAAVGRRAADGLAAGGKDDRCRLTVVRVVNHGQCGSIDLGDRICDRCFVNAGCMRRGAKIEFVESTTNLQGCPVNAAIENSRALRVRDVEIRELNSRLRGSIVSAAAHAAVRLQARAAKTVVAKGRESLEKCSGCSWKISCGVRIWLSDGYHPGWPR